MNSCFINPYPNYNTDHMYYQPNYYSPWVEPKTIKKTTTTSEEYDKSGKLVSRKIIIVEEETANYGQITYTTTGTSTTIRDLQVTSNMAVAN